MQDNKQGLQANPEYTIHYLSQEIMNRLHLIGQIL